MGINVKRETEMGEVVHVVFDTKDYFPALLSRCQGRQWRLIGYIDPCGDTVFNQLQIPTLLEEVGELGEYTQSAHERQFLSAVLDFIERSRDQVHTHVKFCGD